MIDEVQLDDHHRIIHHGGVWFLQSRMSDGKTYTDWQTHGRYKRKEGAIAAYRRRVAIEDPSRRDE
jgi:hypothetical protein